MSAEPEPLWTEKQVAKFLGVSPDTVGNWVKKGYLPVVYLGPTGRNKRFVPATIRALAVERGIKQAE